jgi:hypothetical protein
MTKPPDQTSFISMCQGKAAMSAEQARDVIRRADRSKSRDKRRMAYKCPCCRAWHVGSPPPKGARRPARPHPKSTDFGEAGEADPAEKGRHGPASGVWGKQAGSSPCAPFREAGEDGEALSTLHICARATWVRGLLQHPVNPSLSSRVWQYSSLHSPPSPNGQQPIDGIGKPASPRRQAILPFRGLDPPHPPSPIKARSTHSLQPARNHKI